MTGRPGSPRPRATLAALGLAGLSAPLLLFPRGALPGLGLTLLVAVWVARGATTGRWLVRTPLDRPLGVLLLASLVSLYPSVDLGLSLPKLWGILLGLYVFYLTVACVSSHRAFWIGTALLVAAVAGVALLGLVGTEWNDAKYPLLAQAYDRLPRVITTVQSSVGRRAGFHPNELGGTLAFLLPLPLALLLSGHLPTRWRLVLLGTTLLGLAVLALSASRSAVASLALVAVALVAWRSRLAGLSLAAGGLVALGFVVARDAAAVGDLLVKVDAASVAAGAASVPVRLEIWSAALRMIRDFPATGVGLNTFPVILDTLYPLVSTGSPARIPHAHNVYLHTAVDLGLGGLLGFLGAFGCVAPVGWQAFRGQSSGGGATIRAALVGLGAGLLTYLAFGLTDTITLGAKPSVLLWLMMGLIVAAAKLPEVHPDRPEGAETSARLKPAWLAWRRAGALGVAVAGRAYWGSAYLLVGLGCLAVALDLLG